MAIVRKTDLIHKGLDVLSKARFERAEMRVASAEVAKAYAMLADALGEQAVRDAD